MNKVDIAVHKMRELRYEYSGQEMYIGHSGGKDSVVVTHLADLAFPEGLPIVHTPKPGITHPKTIEFLYQLNRKIIYCPQALHSTLGLQVQIDGTRIAEYDRTDGRSTDVVVDGQNVSRQNMPFFVRSGLFGLSFIFPIYNWSDEDVWGYIKEHSLPVSEEYAT
jgi:3'-phosphoadenosine 5'-phosphosulfate sulfotransferase (PAPS reductase)/FAD synthetase